MPAIAPAVIPDKGDSVVWVCVTGNEDPPFTQIDLKE